jgi:hypothetical protein
MVMKSNPHPANIFNTLQGYLDHAVGPRTNYVGSGKYDSPEFYDRCVRRHTATWKKHIEKHGHVPLILKCSTCSGKGFKNDIKHGKFKESTREDQKELKSIIDDLD